MSRFANRVVLVTGAAGGLGSEIGGRFHAEGATVFAADLDPSRIDGPVDRWHALPLDIRSDAAWAQAMDAVVARAGRLDVLVNCAGMIRAGNVETLDLDDWDRTLSTNATGTMLGCRHAVRVMKAAGGAIVNVSTAMVRRPQAVQIAYGASKAAVEHVTQAVALHCGRAGYRIRCNAVEPGALDSPMLRSNRPADMTEAAYLDAVTSRHPLGRLGTFADVAKVVLFLASDDAGYMTGAIVPVEGGATA
jgi:NAD(P)-dependent dehydrogenase (short-subunit alcohol dehydrogenase family)